MSLCLHERCMAQFDPSFGLNGTRTRLSCLHLSQACHLIGQQWDCWYGLVAEQEGK